MDAVGRRATAERACCPGQVFWRRQAGSASVVLCAPNHLLRATARRERGRNATAGVRRRDGGGSIRSGHDAGGRPCRTHGADEMGRARPRSHQQGLRGGAAGLAARCAARGRQLVGRAGGGVRRGARGRGIRNLRRDPRARRRRRRLRRHRAHDARRARDTRAGGRQGGAVREAGESHAGGGRAHSRSRRPHAATLPRGVQDAVRAVRRCAARARRRRRARPARACRRSVRVRRADARGPAVRPRTRGRRDPRRRLLPARAGDRPRRRGRTAHRRSRLSRLRRRAGLGVSTAGRRPRSRSAT